MKKSTIVIIILVILIGVFSGAFYYYTGTPTYSLYKIKKAISQHDSVTFNKYVDVDRVVSSLIEQATSSLEDDGELKDNPFKELATAFMSSMKEQIKNAINKSVEEISEGKSDSKISEVKIDKVVKEGKSAKVTLKNSNGETINIDMIQTPERYWRIVGINLDDYKKINPLELENNSNQEENKKITSSGKLGEEISIGEGWFLTVNTPENYIPPKNSFSEPSEGNKFIAVEIKYSNQSSKEDRVSPGNLTLKDSENHSYKYMYGGKEPELESGTLIPADDKLKGYVTFEVPKNAEISKAIYANDTATITYDVAVAETPYMGVRYVLLNKQIKQENNLAYDYGALVLRGENKDEVAVVPNSPADKIGIKENDIILEVSNEKITEDNDLAGILKKHKVGDKLTLLIWSRGTTNTIEVTLEKNPQQ